MKARKHWMDSGRPGKKTVHIEVTGRVAASIVMGAIGCRRCRLGPVQREASRPSGSGDKIASAFAVE